MTSDNLRDLIAGAIRDAECEQRPKCVGCMTASVFAELDRAGKVVVSAEDLRKACAPTDRDEFVKWAKEMFIDLGLTVVRVEDLRTYVADEAPDFSDYVRAQVRLRAARPERIDHA